ncbi:leader peptidase (prepilin peptidase) / N-methyltransferase [Nakamurella panacisegetis]|uniref:Prepilin leader peptidase/N-methyltransferase n=1 Tax=Nakamurella panacisegetis TaxID=1090615 RepID=A0A1H0R8H9_9ACTN|nr:leader peptidase (prepilin peptidase) / N-methyltransferase [Nakamurella panacisegetis]
MVLAPTGTEATVPLVAVLSGLFGLAIGSFLNVVIYRTPRQESLIAPASHCPLCGEPIRARHNIPVLGWLLLHGRCADCGSTISVRYPLVELTTALLFAGLCLRLSALQLLPALPAYAYLAAVGVTLAMIDLDHRRLPNVIILPSYVIIAGLLAGASLWTHDWSALARAGAGGVALFAFYLLLAVIHPAGMGMGDVKLAGILGAILGYLSWAALIIGAFGGFLLGAIVGIAVLAAGRGTRKSALPFGPFMITGAILAIFVGDPLAQLYLRAMGQV